MLREVSQYCDVISNALVSTRAAQMKIPPNQVLKELIWVADGKPVLVLSNGDDPIDDNYLAAALGCAVDQLSRPKKLELEPLCGLPAHLISAFSPSLKVDKIVVNQRILDLPEVATSSGRTEVSLAIKPAIFTRLPNVVVANLVNAELVEQLRIEREQRKMEALAREQALRQAANNNNNNNTDTTTNNTTNATTETQLALATQHLLDYGYHLLHFDECVFVDPNNGSGLWI